MSARSTSDRVDRNAYLIVVHGDEDRMIDGDICEVIENHYRVTARVLEPGLAAPADEVRDDYERARAALAQWVKDWLNEDAETWDLPAPAVHFVLAAHGMEANRVGTAEALAALSDECEDCYGDGYHQDDSHPSNPQVDCTTCDGHGHGRVPLRARPKPRVPGQGQTGEAAQDA